MVQSHHHHDHGYEKTNPKHEHNQCSCHTHIAINLVYDVEDCHHRDVHYDNHWSHKRRLLVSVKWDRMINVVVLWATDNFFHLQLWLLRDTSILSNSLICFNLDRLLSVWSLSSEHAGQTCNHNYYNADHYCDNNDSEKPIPDITKPWKRSNGRTAVSYFTWCNTCLDLICRVEYAWRTSCLRQTSGWSWVGNKVAFWTFWKPEIAFFSFWHWPSFEVRQNACLRLTLLALVSERNYPICWCCIAECIWSRSITTIFYLEACFRICFDLDIHCARSQWRSLVWFIPNNLICVTIAWCIAVARQSLSTIEHWSHVFADLRRSLLFCCNEIRLNSAVVVVVFSKPVQSLRIDWQLKTCIWCIIHHKPSLILLKHFTRWSNSIVTIRHQCPILVNFRALLECVVHFTITVLQIKGYSLAPYFEGFLAKVAILTF